MTPGYHDCLRRLGMYIAAGARLQWAYDGVGSYKFYLFERYGDVIAEAATLQELITALPKSEKV